MKNKLTVIELHIREIKTVQIDRIKAHLNIIPINKTANLLMDLKIAATAPSIWGKPRCHTTSQYK